MSPLRSLGLVSFILIACASGLAPGPARADIPTPSRLLLREIEPGVYDVVFTLPLVEGMKLRAEPLLPPTCARITDPVESAAGGYQARWAVECDPPSLAGEVVLIRGLAGTRVDILLRIETLDGRIHTEMLKPARPGFVVPDPASIAELARDHVPAGLRATLTCIELWILILVAAGLRLGWSAAGWALLAFALAEGLGRWLGSKMWLDLPGSFFSLAVLMTALVPAVDLARGGTARSGWMRPAWLAALGIGLFSAAARTQSLDPEGLSRPEQVWSLAFAALGSALGLLLLGLIAFELRAVLIGGRGPSREMSVERGLGFLTATGAWALLVYHASIMVQTPLGLPPSVAELVLLAVVVGATASGPVSRIGPLMFVVALGSGLAWGYADAIVGATSLLAHAILLALAACLAFGRRLRPVFWIALGFAGLLAQGAVTGDAIELNISRPVAAVAGVGLLAAAAGYACQRTVLGGPESATRSVRIGARILGAIAGLLAIGWRGTEILAWATHDVATQWALGRFTLPVVTPVLLVAAALVWPRRRRALQALGVRPKATILHWFLLGAALFLIPVGTVSIRNPFFEPQALRGEDARRVMDSVLTQTYLAFNLKEENETYDRLTESVSGDLVADLYLDSRRRLTAGTRQGAEVTVRDVSVLELGDAEARTSSDRSFAYPCKWVVTARVRHLQHIHHRQNIYNGVLTLRPEGDRWKIAEVELTSEDRVVISWKSS